jgi:pimeloyl-ACP methyl ester carboxylesterase
MRRRLLGLPLALVLSLFLVVPPGAARPVASPSPAAAQVEIDIPAIDWGPCQYQEPPAECAVVRLPLDYDDPDGPTTPVKVLRKPATGERIGSLFVNPGGPGGSTLDFALYAGREIGPGVNRRFDVIGVEPRGVGLNPPATCRTTAATTPRYPWVSFPIEPRQVKRWLRADRRLNRACRESRSPITDHASTADYARDIDVVRQAVGDEALTFYGISYGSVVGQTYAAMFPDRVRAIIVDGVLDPIAWTSGGSRPHLPSTYRLGSGRGAYEALVSALNECDRVGRSRCAIAGHANQSWLSAYRRARHGDLARITPQDLVSEALGALYSARSVRYLIDFLRETDRTRATATDRPRLADAWRDLRRSTARRDEIGPYGAGRAGRADRATAGAPAYGRQWVEFHAVLCSDAVNPDDPRAWARTSRLADRTQPWFGRSWTWRGSLCAGWPGKGGEDAFRGPWRTTTSTPLLVVGNTHDPATPIRGARAANRLFAGSVLLTLNAWGHGALGASACIQERMAAYLIEQRLPRPSSWCRPDRPLFP